MRERIPGGIEQADYLVVAHRPREPQGRKPRRMNYLIRIGISDSRENPWIGESPFQGMVLSTNGRHELIQSGGHRLDAARIMLPQCSLTNDNIKRRAMFAAGLGHMKRACREIERGEADPRNQHRARTAPPKASGNHEMNHEVVIAIQRNHHPLSNATNPRHLSVADGLYRRLRSAQKERLGDSSPLQGLAHDSTTDRREVSFDVGQFRHGMYVTCEKSS